MTDKPTPTDAEILDAAEDFRSQYTHGGTTFDEFDEIGFAREVLAKWGQPAPATQQAAPKAAPGVGNSGFDHKTAADFLSGKTVSDEAVRKFVQASRWAHDEKAALSAMLLSVRGELTSREAEIALLKKALLEAETAPQPAPAPLSDDAKDAARWRMVVLIGNEVMLHPEKRTQAAAVKAYMDATHSGSDLTGAVDAAIAAQGGKDA